MDIFLKLKDEKWYSLPNRVGRVSFPFPISSKRKRGVRRGQGEQHIETLAKGRHGRVPHRGEPKEAKEIKRNGSWQQVLRR
jgi:hypothetical protein